MLRWLRQKLACTLGACVQEAGCSDMKKVAQGKIEMSCAWDTSPQHKRSWGGGPLLWHLRWRFLARAARLGYNVLSMDRWAPVCHSW